MRYFSFGGIKREDDRLQASSYIVDDISSWKWKRAFFVSQIERDRVISFVDLVLV